ncbi:hypothetical protein [Acidipropionibacterium jensenii]|jgi:hypothetical protein|uniref:hypothetical protein n=1 Tax=Acidipropionibacterium jensenii TaxID=1749 RepID=UPI00264767ED|nr:hypothetical protein [Acidipropionibacterium jensenii]MDN6428182.1 hypothetical protein [Acidipropionibacterium jensenii]
MSTIDDAAEVIGRYVHPDFAEDAARALAAEGHLAPDLTIIRTVEDEDARLVRRLVGPVEVAEGERLSVCGFL